jgi:hypothetical protein
MVNTHIPRVFAATWITLAIAIWLVAVPSWMSLTNFVWLNAAVAVIGIILAKTLRSAGPTRSIAHVLFDTEQQTGRGR